MTSDNIESQFEGEAPPHRPHEEFEEVPHVLTDEDIARFNQGLHSRLYLKFGAHRAVRDGAPGVYFAVWAPEAEGVSVVGSFNSWNKDKHPLGRRGNSGVWEGFIPGVENGALYKFFIRSRFAGYRVTKADPFAVFNEIAPKSASIVWDLQYSWEDQAWMSERKARNALSAPMSIYELHLGSWRRVAEEGNRSLSYREMAPRLAAYVRQLGFTHVEFLPLMDHPFFGSWGYQITGYFAPSGNYGTPQDLMFLIDTLHQNGIGVIFDWVPSHFPTDEHGLAYFDGSHLFEHADPRQGVQPEWNSYVFNYGRPEVRSFLISNAIFWLDRYHVDGLRVDAVASMLYLDYGRREGEWVANRYGGRENLEAIEFLKQFNKTVYEIFPDVQTIAEESTSWPLVSRPLYLGGLGFGLKWDMGWMHDTLEYFSQDPIYRKYHHHQLTFRLLYAFHENFVLPLSHDEVVYGKRSLLNKMPGDDWQRFANLRLLLGYMYAQPGKKLLFMGGEIAQRREWTHDQALEWELLDLPLHSGMQRWVADLNRFYRAQAALYEVDFDPAGFEWIDCNDSEASVVSLLRKGRGENDIVLIVCNFTPVVRHNYLIGTPRGGVWNERLNSDAKIYGGSGVGNLGEVEAAPVSCHGRRYSLALTLPPLSVLFLGQGSEQ
ncbi:MAG TPA: 1,4-alpha-glucan branching protein GlgB [Verrucomicrobiae bacterium]|nr:1,4-alpha-glucan branching protein GlgB [Verrucomicrobiae bacterium]